MPRSRRWLAPLLAVVTGGGAIFVWHGAVRGAGKDEVTWSGRIRVESQSKKKYPKTYYAGRLRSDGSQESLAVSEYRVEKAPQDGTDVTKDDTLVVVSGSSHERSYLWDYATESTTDRRLQGSGQTVAGFSLYVRGKGEEDEGHCRLEFGPVGQRQDGGPLSEDIPLRGTERIVIWGNYSADETKSVESRLGPASEQFDFACPADARSLQGEKVEKDEDGYTRITWDLVRDGEPQTEVELTLPQGYDKWMPQAHEREDAVGNYIEIGVSAHKKGDKSADPPRKVVRYRIELNDVSRERGVDANWPPSAKAPGDLDLKIEETKPFIKLTGPNGQRAEVTEKGLKDFKVRVNSHDWGGHGCLRVVAEMEGGGVVVAHVQGHLDMESVALPKDDNRNQIADAWEGQSLSKGQDPSADDDETPVGDGHEGDAIDLYDEYRGFHIGGVHERLSPTVKDLFIFDSAGFGVGSYPAMTGIRTHLINGNERAQLNGVDKGNSNRANPNSNQRPVYAVVVHRWPMGDGTVGWAVGGPSVPRDIEFVKIDHVQLKLAATNYQAELGWTVAHELGHASNLLHHGDADLTVGDVRCRQPDGTFKNNLCNEAVKGDGGKRTVRGAAFDCNTVAIPGGTFSGNDKCVMRYIATDYYKSSDGPCTAVKNQAGQTVKVSEYGVDPPGTILCNSPKGTGVNAGENSKAGDADEGRGACLHKFCINSWRH